MISGDTVVFSDTAATFADANAANGKTVSVGGINATGADSANYSYNATTTTTANITPKVLNLTGTRAYDGTTAAAANLFGAAGTLTGVNGETLTLGGSGTLTSNVPFHVLQ